MLFLHHPYAVNHLPVLERTKKPTVTGIMASQTVLNPGCAVCRRHLVVGDLLQIQVGGVDHLHAGVAVVSAAEGAPVFGVGVEPIGLLPAALSRSRTTVNPEGPAGEEARATPPHPPTQGDIYKCGGASPRAGSLRDASDSPSCGGVMRHSLRRSRPHQSRS